MLQQIGITWGLTIRAIALLVQLYNLVDSQRVKVLYFLGSNESVWDTASQTWVTQQIRMFLLTAAGILSLELSFLMSTLDRSNFFSKR